MREGADITVSGTERFVGTGTCICILQGYAKKNDCNDCKLYSDQKKKK